MAQFEEVSTGIDVYLDCDIKQMTKNKTEPYVEELRRRVNKMSSYMAPTGGKVRSRQIISLLMIEMDNNFLNEGNKDTINVYHTE